MFVQVSANNGLDGVLTLQATPSVFYNECEIVFKLDWKGVAQLPSDVNVQVTIGFKDKIFIFTDATLLCP